MCTNEQDPQIIDDSIATIGQKSFTPYTTKSSGKKNEDKN